MSRNKIKEILNKEKYTKENLVFLLSFHNKEERSLIFEKSKKIKQEYVGDIIYLRGLIEYSNRCSKDCFYCGIRSRNTKVERYTVSEENVLNCADYAYKNDYASIVIQSGEINNKEFTDNITSLLEKIHKLTNNSLRVTLSCGEQTAEIYKKWYEAGAHRYLLRIESSNEVIYRRIHPNNEKHSFQKRIQALNDLRTLGYQVGTGVMIGLPGQGSEDLADDLLFLQNFDIDMVGMGPYVEHIDTPLYSDKDKLLSQQDRFSLSLTMFALLRIMMKDINIASATALDAIEPNGRLEALNIACNVLMPNLTPINYIENYHLYNNKPDSMHADKLVKHFENFRTLHGNSIAFGQHGDSKHFHIRNC